MEPGLTSALMASSILIFCFRWAFSNSSFRSCSTWKGKERKGQLSTQYTVQYSFFGSWSYSTVQLHSIFRSCSKRKKSKQMEPHKHAATRHTTQPHVGPRYHTTTAIPWVSIL